MSTDATLGEAKIQGKGRSLCELHPEVDYRVAWGCPECVMELRSELADARREIERLREALQEARMFVGSHALGQTMTHRADTLLKHIVQALQPTPAKPC